MRSLAVGIALVALIGSQAAPDDADLPPDEVAQVALQTASDYLGVPTDNLLVVSAEQHDWPDSAIGCPLPGRAYAQMVTPGYIVTLDTDDQTSEVRVNTDRGSRGVIC